MKKKSQKMADGPLQRVRQLPKNFFELSEAEKREWARQYLAGLSPNPEVRKKRTGPASDL